MCTATLRMSNVYQLSHYSLLFSVHVDHPEEASQLIPLVILPEFKWHEDIAYVYTEWYNRYQDYIKLYQVKFVKWYQMMGHQKQDYQWFID